jgi:hypothetical protein
VDTQHRLFAQSQWCAPSLRVLEVEAGTVNNTTHHVESLHACNLGWRGLYLTYYKDPTHPLVWAALNFCVELSVASHSRRRWGMGPHELNKCQRTSHPLPPSPPTVPHTHPPPPSRCMDGLPICASMRHPHCSTAFSVLGAPSSHACCMTLE